MNYNLKPLSVNCDKNDNMVEMILFITRSETEKLKYIRGSLFNWGHFSSRRVCSFLWKLHLFFVGKGSFLTSNNNQGSAKGLFDQSIHKSSNQIVDQSIWINYISNRIIEFNIDDYFLLCCIVIWYHWVYVHAHILFHNLIYMYNGR